MTIEEIKTPSNKPLATLHNNVVGSLLPNHLKALLQTKSENQEATLSTAQMSRYLEACGDCV